MDPASAAVLRPLPRPAPPPRLPPVERPARGPVPEPSLALLAARGTRWYVAMWRFVFRVALDAARGRKSLARVGAHLRAAFEEVGGPAVKVGQQLSMRVDLLPFELCMELGKLTDRARPFSAEEAVAAVEDAIGGPLGSVFADFDPEPIGSASIACVYKARLRGGEAVAVKVRRPEVAGQFAADIRAFELWTRAMEALTVVRPGFFAAMREEVRGMFYEELDLRIEARYQSLYARYARRAGLDWLTCPRVHRRYCNDRVIVSEFIAGVPCARALAALEAGDPAARAELAANDIDPATLARRVYYIALWGRLEAPFFHGDPHPANVIILPGSRICMIDFGACGVSSRRLASIQHEVLRLLVENRVSEASKVVLAQFSPLPRLDVDALGRSLEATLWRYTHGLNDDDAPWFDRTSAALWLAMVEATQRFGLQVNLDTLRLMRSTLLYDTLANRLSTKTNVDDTLTYLREKWQREAARVRRRARHAGLLRARLLGRLDALRGTLETTTRRVEVLRSALERPFGRLVGQWAMLARWALGNAALVVALVVVAEVLEEGARAGWWLVPGWSGRAGAALTRPFGLLVLALVVCLSGLRLRHRLHDES